MRKALLAVLSGTVLFVGCGGGGGTSTASILNKEAVAAPVTVENGKEVARDVTSSRMNSNLMVLNGISDESGLNTAIVAQTLFKEASRALPSSGSVLNETINESEECDYGGSISYSGSGNETSGGRVLINFNHCKNDPDLEINGKINVEVRLSHGEPSYYKITVPSDLTLQADEISMVTYAGSWIVVDNFTNDGESFDMSYTTKIRLANRLYGSENSKMHMDITYNGLSFYQIRGKEYIDNLTSYVRYDTSYDMSQTPFVFDSLGLRSGTAMYVGENEGKIKVEVTDLNEVTVFIDADNDGVYEEQESIESFLQW